MDFKFFPWGPANLLDFSVKPTDSNFSKTMGLVLSCLNDWRTHLSPAELQPRDDPATRIPLHRLPSNSRRSRACCAESNQDWKQVMVRGAEGPWVHIFKALMSAHSKNAPNSEKYSVLRACLPLHMFLMNFRHQCSHNWRMGWAHIEALPSVDMASRDTFWDSMQQSLNGFANLGRETS